MSTKNDLSKVRAKYVLASKPLGKLYHFLSAEKLLNALKTNQLLPHGGSLPLDIPKRLLHYINDSGDRNLLGVSTTRNPIWKPNWGKYWDSVRLTLDGTKLSTRYKIISYNDFWKFQDHFRRKISDNFYSQAEEKILTTRTGVQNFTKYLLSVEILERGESPSGSLRSFDRLKVGEQLDRLGIPWKYVKEFSPTVKVAANRF